MIKRSWLSAQLLVGGVFFFPHDSLSDSSKFFADSFLFVGFFFVGFVVILVGHVG